MNIHFIGIGGIGLSALGRFLKHDGHYVSGSDIKSSPITKQLECEGIKVITPHNASIINNQDIVIHSAAVKPNNVEILQAVENGIKTIPRKEALPIVLGDKKNYCVAGAHGKSTTTAILASILKSSTLIGAISKEFDSNFRYVDNLVAFEADESDGSFLLSNPYCAIVTNAEPEHMEYYNYDLKRFYQAYESFLKIAKVRVINAEDEFLGSLDIEAIKLHPSIDITEVSYTLKNGEPYTKFHLKDLGEFEVWGFGYHIAIDASLAILAALNEIPLVEIKDNIKNYKGIKKRFDIVQKSEQFVVIDDYAHHPTEIAATMKSVSLYSNLKNMEKIVVVWQPHKYSRTVNNLEEFKKCFNGCDALVILPVYSAGEEIEEIDFEKEFSSYNPIFADKIKTSDNKIELIKDDKIVYTYTDGIVLGVGAGDITYQLRVK
ncbi:UDP-N-acetylmuramate--L-alanine ligase [Malaciobacter marinus]|uniref:UDP-N-acetylmuramate--L-alanine ligase n=1 Tax=Malaciobacter marinus TaxID=505249 RepID=A0A347TNM5_9BACT|nr:MULTISPECIES: UDP-N-acetylmuramate--L-alanine ligase [Malaciobacter]AXX88203.1 UDP-N-acetylmuramate-alanine ligase [Malaciobacter marinus]PHO15736.1 UDP-N-acetylmuramate--L-alanine ligase [Malaciobacter marinus]RYA24410.1 UDP-N-acetylmuramate--L-alanine ligase [Malaciobacter halophilus]